MNFSQFLIVESSEQEEDSDEVYQGEVDPYPPPYVPPPLKPFWQSSAFAYAVFLIILVVVFFLRKRQR